VLRAEGAANEPELRVIEVVEREADGAIIHWLEESNAGLQPGAKIHGEIDAARRRDHMQQHSGQHVLSAAFLRLMNAPTVSFHLGEESCSIDLTTDAIDSSQIVSAEELANHVVTDDRPVEIRYATREDAERLGLRKLPPRTGEIRLIDIRDFDLTACGGTHVRSTGQIGAILLRKREKVKQGMRLEFVCGARAVRASRGDYQALTGAAELFSAHPRDVAEMARKIVDELRSAGKAQQKLLEQLAEYEAHELVAQGEPVRDLRFVQKIYSDRDAGYAKLIARKLATQRVVAAIASALGQPTVVLACSPDTNIDRGAIVKQALAAGGGRGGGAREMAQGGVADPAKLALVMARIRDLL